MVHDAEQNVPQRNYADGDYELSGEIPPWLGSLSKLTYLDLSFNKLSGEIPAELGSLSKLNSLGLSYNDLSGCVPNSLEDQLNYLIGLPFC